MPTNLLDGRVAITGTGRCGTTFLTRLLTEIDPRLTGYQDPDSHTYSHRAGLERVIAEDDLRVVGPAEAERMRDLPRVWKDPRLSITLRVLLAAGHRPAGVIVPVRSFRDAATSRIESGREWYPFVEPPIRGSVELQAAALAGVFGFLAATLAVERVPRVYVPWRALGDADELWRTLGERMIDGDHDVLTLLGVWDLRGFRHAHVSTWAPTPAYPARPVGAEGSAA